MDIAVSDFLSVLESRGVEELYHANTVTTSCSLLTLGALCSRKEVEDAGLRQTSQFSDQDDKRFGVWDCVFLDTFDIHSAVESHNNYGPVLFGFHREFLNQGQAGCIRVTRCNPTKWESLSDEDRWFQNIDSLREEFEPGNLDHMVVVPSPGRSLRLDGMVSTILVDDPEAEVEGVDAYPQAFEALQEAARTGALTLPPPRRRVCSASCKCVENYHGNSKFRWKFFSPNVGT